MAKFSQAVDKSVWIWYNVKHEAVVGLACAMDVSKKLELNDCIIAMGDK